MDSCSETLTQGNLLPWESGVFKQIFESEEAVSWNDSFDLPQLPIPDDAGEILPPSEKKRRVEESGMLPGICFSVVRKGPGISWEEQRDRDFDRAIARWSFVIIKWSEVSPDLLVCRSLLDCDTIDERTDVLKDWLHPKAPGTLLKRVNSLLRYHKSAGWSEDVFPYKEAKVYEYMSAARSGGAKPSQMRALREAIIFARHMFTIPELDAVISSRRCLGVSLRGQKKCARKRADPLTVKNLRLLHAMLRDLTVPAWDRVFAGATLCCSYMRSRWSDFQHASSFQVEYGEGGERLFLEYTCEVYKTVNSKFFAGQPIRFVAPGRGIVDDNWLDLWYEARLEIGIDDFVPPLPTPGPSGDPTGASVSTEEIARWLRKVCGDREHLRTSGHTLKRTFLTMATKRGVEHLDRLVLGGHANSAGMADVYGGDELARPLRLLIALIYEIKSGIFDPDAGRAAYLKGGGLTEPRLGGSSPPRGDPSSAGKSWLRVDQFGKESDDAVSQGNNDPFDAEGSDCLANPPDDAAGEAGEAGTSCLPEQSALEAGEAAAEADDSSSSSSRWSPTCTDLRARSVMTPPFAALLIASLRCNAVIFRRALFIFASGDFLCGLEIVAGNMSLVDSTAAFKQRCHDVDGSALLTALEAQGITSFASLAYACGTPQDRPTQAEMDAFATRILGAAPRLGDIALLKRLLFEACTYVIAQLRQSVQGETSETPRKLPLAEKAARAEDQKRRLVGVHIERHDNSLKVGNDQPKDTASFDSPIKLQWCLQRRGLALDQADREAWLIMASEVKSLKVTAAGDFPLGVALDALRTDPRITMLKAASSSRTTTPTGKAPSAARTMPAELKDAHQKAEDGTPICWDHNCGGCKNKTEGDPPRVLARASPNPSDSVFHLAALAQLRLLRFQALAEVERLAAACLRAGFVSFDSLMSMSALLPADTVQGPSGPAVWLLAAGAPGATAPPIGTMAVLFLHLLPLSSTTAVALHLLLIGLSPPPWVTLVPAPVPRAFHEVTVSTAASGYASSPASTSAATINRVFPDQVAPLVLEVFAGTARLSSACQRLGFRTLAVDKASVQSRFPIQQLDLTLADDLAMLLDIIRLESANIAWIHCAPPCGTASAARSRPLAGVDPSMKAPVPLRSTTEPQGLSTLHGRDRLRVDQANLLYRAVGAIADLALELKIFISIENPANSLAWLCDGLDHLFRLPHHQVVFDACMHGGTRDKRGLLWCSDDRFLPLALLCSRDHAHASWRSRVLAGTATFPAKDEAAYPHLLCERMAYIVAEHSDRLRNSVPEPRQPAQMHLEKQPRFARPLVSCYRDYDSWAVPVRAAEFLLALLRCYPKGARVVQRKLVPWGMVRVCVPSLCPAADFSTLKEAWNDHMRQAEPEQHFLEQLHHEETVQVCGLLQSDDPCSTSAELIVVGIPREPQDFVNEAVKAGHPRNGLASSRSGPAADIVDAVLLSFEDREKRAEATRQRWSNIEATTRSLNDKILKGKPKYLVEALGNKNVLAWRDILRHNGFKDDQLWADLRDGFRLTGWMRDTGIFDKKLRPPETTLERLLEQSSYRTPLTLNKLRKTVVDETTRKAWAETLEEEKKGWIFREEMAAGKPMVIAHRFGLEQKGKVRVIDTGKECGLNLACGLPEKFTLHGVDVLAGIFVELLNRRYLLLFIEDWLESSSGRTGWCAYFDDFPLLAVEGHEAQVNGFAGEVFDALDVEYAKEGKKATEFGETFNALGLSFDLTRFRDGVVTLRHTEARTAELLETLDGILQERKLRPKDAEVLRGRMHWYTSYLFGRAPCEAMHQISIRAQGHDACASLTPELEEALMTMKFFLSDPKPLEIRQTTGREMFVFTDGSYEPDGDIKAGIGGVLYDDTGTPLSFFSSDMVGSDLLTLEDQSDHPIYEVELYAAVVAFELWGHLIQDSFTVFFLDNEAAQSALIAGKSGTSNGRVLVQRFLDAEHRWRARPWIGRVPTYSNPADDPSRSICEPLIKQGARRMDVSSVRLLS
ncbi:unnamed protein product [Symbiodinium sp. CCMP2456]|nr:unnamed protein product [Symbiodinium sp. CCMP2456]